MFLYVLCRTLKNLLKQFGTNVLFGDPYLDCTIFWLCQIHGCQGFELAFPIHISLGAPEHFEKSAETRLGWLFGP